MRYSLRTLSVLSAAMIAASCTSWQRNPSASEGIARARSGEIRVLEVDGTTMRLISASIVGDSLIGISPVTGSRVAIPNSAIASIETKGVSAGRTALLGAGILVGTAALLLVALLVALSTTGEF